MSDAQPKSRRELFTRMWKPVAAAQKAAQEPVRRPKLVAQIQSYECLASRGQVCTVCAERCPEPGAVRVEGMRVQIVESACTGCGICRDVCPAPNPAIVLWPGAQPKDGMP